MALETAASRAASIWAGHYAGVLELLPLPAATWADYAVLSHGEVIQRNRGVGVHGSWRSKPYPGSLAGCASPKYVSAADAFRTRGDKNRRVVTPLVRAVIVNYNAATLLERCLSSLAASDWPADQLEIVVVDNGSEDDSVVRAGRVLPHAVVVETGQNLGFGAAANLALEDLKAVDYVALVNNDAFVEPGWLSPLVRALEADPGLGASCPKIVFASRFVELEVEAPARAPGRGDYRRLGVRASSAEVDGVDRWQDAQFVRGWHAGEHGVPGESRYRWSSDRALLRLPAGESGRLQVAAQVEKELLIRSWAGERAYLVGRSPSWIEVDMTGLPVDVVHNAGSIAVRGGYGGDRGFLEVDRGQYNAPVEVFAWCGCAALLRRAYLEDVGRFDPSLFLYYEDFDLSWRGRARGWRYVYVPKSVVRHVHTASSDEGAPRFQHYIERNRLLVHVKNAPAGYAANAVARYLGGTGRDALRDVISPLLRGERPHVARVVNRLRTLGAAIAQLPKALRVRRRLRRAQTVSDRELLSWAKPPPR